MINVNEGAFVEPTFEDVSKALVTETIAARLLDSLCGVADSQSITTGQYSSFFATRRILQSSATPSSPIVVTTPSPYSLRAVSYLHQPIQSSVAATALFDLALLLLDDTSITETDKAVVDAYSQIDSAQEFYDRAKSFLFDNYAGETSPIVSRTGNTIDAGSFDVVVDASAPSAFAFDGSTITIRSSNFVGDITTAGLIFLSNDASLTGVASDASGTTGLLTIK